MIAGTWAAPVGENLSYGRQSARERVMELIIDDGFSSRGHRVRMFDAGLKVAGVSCGPHTSLGSVCVATPCPMTDERRCQSRM